MLIAAFTGGAIGAACVNPAAAAPPKPGAAPAAAPAAEIFRIGQRVNAFGSGGSGFSGSITSIQGDTIQITKDDGEAVTSPRKNVKYVPLPDPTFFQSVQVGTMVSIISGGGSSEGTVLEMEEGKVRIKYVHGGGEYTFPLEYVRAPGSRGTTGLMPVENGIPTGDFSGVSESQPSAAAWAVKPDPAPAAKPSPAKVIPINVGRQAASSGVKRMLFTDAAIGQALLTYHFLATETKPEVGRYRRVNLVSGEVMETVELEADRELVAISPNGRQAVARVRIKKNNERAVYTDASDSSVQFLNLTGGKMTPGLHWRPYDPDETLTHIQFTDEDHLLTQSHHGVIVYWELPPPNAPKHILPRAVYRLKAGTFHRPELSPGGKYFAVMDHTTLRIVETATGTHLGSLPDVGNGMGAISFKADGLLAAVSVYTRVQVIHLPSARIIRTIFIPEAFTRANFTSLDWLTNAHLLLNGSTLLDLGKRLATWRYHFTPDRAVAVAHGKVWFSTFEADPKFFSMTLPHEEAVKVEPSIKAEDMLIFKPGLKVSIDRNTDAPEDIKAKTLKSLEQQVAAMGMTVAPDQPVRVQVITTTGQSRDMEYRSFTGGVRTQKITVADKVQRLAVTLDGQEVWKTQTQVGASSFLRLKKDQSIESAIAEGQARSYAFLPSMRLPTVLIKEASYTVAGESKVTSKGLEPFTPR